MKIIIYYFSGTGNTQLVGELYKKHFESAGENSVELYKIHRIEENSLVESHEKIPCANDFDLIGIAFPIYGFNSPEPVYKFAKSLPKISQDSQNPKEKKRAFVFRTGGEGTSLNNYASQKIISLLQKKGYDILCDQLYVMPYNMIFRHSPQMVKSEFIYADAMVKLCVREILDGVHKKVKYFPLRYWFVPLVRLVWPYAKFQGKFIMKVNKKKCVQCGACVRNCPQRNIRFDEKKQKYIFGADCALCVACSFNCPKDAISLGPLNGWRINGSYQIRKTASDAQIEFPYFGENLKGLMRFLYYKHFRKCDAELKAAGITFKSE